MDWQGEIIPSLHRRWIIIKDIVGLIQHNNKLKISDLERLVVKESCKIVDEEVSSIYKKVPLECDHVGSTMKAINLILNDSTLLQ